MVLWSGGMVGGSLPGLSLVGFEERDTLPRRHRREPMSGLRQSLGHDECTAAEDRGFVRSRLWCLVNLKASLRLGFSDSRAYRYIGKDV